MRSKKVFVTVGTTKFDALIHAASQEKVLNKLKLLGFTKVQFQKGSGTYKAVDFPGLDLSYTPYFENFQDEIKSSDLVVSHAGAGTCLEVLRNEKPLIVVVNEDLMDNHQFELADQLANDGYLYSCICATLLDTLDCDIAKLKTFPVRNASVFNNYLDKCMGFQ